MKAIIDRNGCISCGACAEICPEVFRMADDGLAEIYCQPQRSNIHNAHQAEKNCPVQVIEIKD